MRSKPTLSLPYIRLKFGLVPFDSPFLHSLFYICSSLPENDTSSHLVRMKLTISDFAYLLYCASVASAAPTVKRQSGSTYDGGLTANDVQNGGEQL